MSIITVLNFSARENGNCASVCRYIANQYNSADVRIYNISKWITSCEKCDYACLKNEERCPNQSKDYIKMMDRILGSHYVYFVVPNFCGFPCANYFAYNERSVGYFNQDQKLLEQYLSIPKGFVLISNTESEFWTEAMSQQTNDNPNILYLKSSKYGKRSIDGNILDSEEARLDLQAYLDQNLI